MKRVALVLVILVVGGSLGVAFVGLASIFSKPRFPSTLGVTSSEATNVSRATTISAPMTAEAEPAPVALTPPSPQNLPTPQVASAPDPPPTVAQTSPAPREQAKRAFDATEKEIRSLSEGHCGGRTMKSITILPDGNVQVQC